MQINFEYSQRNSFVFRAKHCTNNDIIYLIIETKYKVICFQKHVLILFNFI